MKLTIKSINRHPDPSGEYSLACKHIMKSTAHLCGDVVSFVSSFTDQCRHYPKRSQKSLSDSYMAVLSDDYSHAVVYKRTMKGDLPLYQITPCQNHN